MDIKDTELMCYDENNGKLFACIDGLHRTAITRLREFLRIQSVSADPSLDAVTRSAAVWVNKYLAQIGLESEIVETAGHPIVMADSGGSDGARPTVLLYGHYDVQPTGNAGDWVTPPFEPDVRSGKIFARGAADNKGQLLALLLAVEAFANSQLTLPVRVRVLIEGEEEIGSPNLASIIRKHRDRLACDVVVVADAQKYDEATPAIIYGTRGSISKEVIVNGPRADLHSGVHGGAVMNPARALAKIIASLHDEEGRVTIPGFYANVRAPTTAESASLDRLAFDEEKYRETLGVTALYGEAHFDSLTRRWFRPALEVSGVQSGSNGSQFASIIPSIARAGFSIRLVPDQDPSMISAAFDAAVLSAAPPGVSVTIVEHLHAPPYACPTNSPFILAAVSAMKKGFGRSPVLVKTGGTLPILGSFKSELNADTILLGFAAPDCNLHGPNEFFDLSDFVAGAQTMACLLYGLGNSRVAV